MKLRLTILLTFVLGIVSVTMAQNDRQTVAGNTTPQQNSLGFTMTPVKGGAAAIRSSAPVKSSQGFTINMPRRNQNTAAANTNRPGGFQSSSTRQITENGARQMGGQQQTGGQQMNGQMNGSRPMGGPAGGARQGVARR